jgi:hypothetical protein
VLSLCRAGFPRFVVQQLDRISSDASEIYPIGASVSHYVPYLGWFTILTDYCLRVAVAVFGGAKERLLLIFPLFYLGMFLLVPARSYFFQTAIPPLF